MRRSHGVAWSFEGRSHRDGADASPPSSRARVKKLAMAAGVCRSPKQLSFHPTHSASLLVCLGSWFAIGAIWAASWPSPRRTSRSLELPSGPSWPSLLDTKIPHGPPARPTKRPETSPTPCSTLRRVPAADTPARRPGATYRLQVHRGFTLDDVAKVVDYLADLGVTDGYLSPYLCRALAARTDTTCSTIGGSMPRSATAGPTTGSCSSSKSGAWGGCSTSSRITWASRASTLTGWMSSRSAPNRHSPATLTSTGRPRAMKSRAACSCRSWKISMAAYSSRENSLLKYDGGRFLIAYHDRELPLSPRSYAMILECRISRLRDLGRGRGRRPGTPEHRRGGAGPAPVQRDRRAEP